MSKPKWKTASRMGFFKTVNNFTSTAFQLLERRKKGQKKVRSFKKINISYRYSSTFDFLQRTNFETKGYGS